MNYDRYINQAIAAVPPSGIRRFFDIAATMKDAISLGVGEPDFVTPYHIRNAAINSIIDGGYDPIYGARPLKRYIQSHVETMIAKEVAEEYGISPKRSASLLDTFSCIFQGIIPLLFYPFLLCLSSLLFILFDKK